MIFMKNHSQYQDNGNVIALFSSFVILLFCYFEVILFISVDIESPKNIYYY